jgi:hypothetical protein
MKDRQGVGLLRFSSALPQSIGLLIRRSMHRKGYYSPILRRDLVTRLYYAAKEARLPMTKLQDRLVEDALNRISTRKTLTIQDQTKKFAA